MVRPVLLGWPAGFDWEMSFHFTILGQTSQSEKMERTITNFVSIYSR